MENANKSLFCISETPSAPTPGVSAFSPFGMTNVGWLGHHDLLPARLLRRRADASTLASICVVEKPVHVIPSAWPSE